VLSRGSPILRVRNGAAQDGSLRAAEGPGLLVYNITNNQITGAALLGTVGLDWQLGGFAARPTTQASANSCKRWPALMAAAGQPIA
jgi:hypothetical protein